MGGALEDESDEWDFDSWARANWSRLLGIARVVTGDPTLAQDVLQDCLVDLYRRWDSIAGDGSRPLAYATRIMGSKAANYRRTAWARRVWTTDDASLLDGRASSESESAHNRLLVTGALRQLSPQQRQIVALHYLLDLPVADIAESLGRPIGSVTSDLSRARKVLRAELLEGVSDSE